jgi:hypothetical protein
MPWPIGQDYQEAVQNPPLVFTDPELRAGQAELDKIGLPRVNSGAFACVFKIQSSGRLWAAKCFTSEVVDQHQRYEAISRHLVASALSQTVPFTYLARGIKIQGRDYPLVKMQWVQGESLSSFVGRSIGYPDTLLSLAKVWSRTMADLKAANIAHGDLQHGNIVVVGDQLRLIDYDGMFVPALSGKQSNELGHRHYQLPTRTTWDYGLYLDNFSAWVIYVSLVALAVHPELWSAYGGGDECLILRKDDFVRPESSAVLRDLNASPNTQLRFLVELFTSLVSLTPQDVPGLDGNVTVVTPAGGSHVSGGQSWWSDHVGRNPTVEETSTEVSQPTEAETTTSDPGWILDSMMENKAVEQLPFRNKFKEVRIIIAGSMALALLARLVVEIPAAQLLVFVSFVFGMNILVCFIRYKRDPSFAEFEAFKQQAKEFIRRVQEHQTVIDAISAERVQVREKFIGFEQDIAEQKRRLGGTLQVNLVNAQAALDSQLRTLNQRRRDNGSSETNKLNSLQGTLGNQISDLHRRIAGLNQQKADEKTRALKALQDAHLENYLRSHLVEDSWIPGVSATLKSRLAAQGFRTAFDIEYWKVRSVPGIGKTRGGALVQWRQGLESEARRSGPNLSPQQMLAIENKYRNDRQTLAGVKQQLQSQLDSQISSVRQYFADLRQSMNQEEQQLRAACAQSKAQIQQTHDSEMAELEQKLIGTKNQTGPTIAELSQKLQNAQKQVFALRWQSAKHEKEGRRFASLRFRDYLRTVISS